MSSLRTFRTLCSRHRSNAVVVAVALLSTGCGDTPAPMEVDELSKVSMDEIFNFTVENDIQFGSALDENGIEEALLLDLFYPTDGTQTLRPAIIWLHGGSFQAGNKGEMTEFARRFARRGYVSVSANYRLRENDTFDYVDPADSLGNEAKRDAQHDVQAAVRWLRATDHSSNVDPNRIYIAGYSAGATAALRVAAWSDDPGSSGNPGPSSTVAGVAAVSVYLEDNMLASITAPTLLIHGQADTKVPFDGIESACASASLCQMVPVPGARHNMLTVEKENIIERMASFFFTLAGDS